MPTLVPRAFVPLLLLLGHAAQAQEPASPPPHTGWLTAQQVAGRDLDVPQPPRAASQQLPDHALPPLPVGTGSLPQPSSPATSIRLAGAAAPAAGQFTYFQAWNSKPSGGSSSVVTEPTVIVNRDTAFQTGNWYAALSTDSGVTWTHVNPYTRLPAADAGFCCDQKTIHIASHDTTVWLLQYGYSGTTQSGRHRIAYTSGRAGLRNNAWSYYDLTPQFFGFANHWLDFPDLTVTTTHVYGTTNVFTPGGTNVDSILWRAELNDFVNGGTTNFAWYLRSTIGSAGGFRLAASVTPTMYAAAHVTLTSLRAYRWGATGNIAWTDVTVPQWAQGTCTMVGADGRDWAGFADGRVLGGYAGSAEYGFMWTSSPVTGRARPFTRVARIRTSDNTLIAAEDIWNSTDAFLYPACATNASGNIGFTVAHGSSSVYAHTVAGIVDGYAPSFAGQTLWAASNGTHGPDRNRWGDYFSVALHTSFPNTFVSIGKRQVSGPADGNAEPQFLWFGRDDFTPVWVDLTVSSSPVGGIPITIAETDRFGRKDGFTGFSRSFPAHQSYTLTAPAQFVSGGQTYVFNVWVLNGNQTTPGQRTLYVDDIGGVADVVEANYVLLRTLTVDSTPARGVPITVGFADRNGQSDGVTAFTRVYGDVTNGGTFNLTAPDTFGGNYLRRWYVNGTPYPPRQRTVPVLMNRDVTVVADYGDIAAIGPQWTNISQGLQPGGRLMHGLAYDANRDRVVLFGGSTDGATTSYNDVWELADSTWQNVVVSSRPPARMGHSMVYDVNRAETIVFGGRANSSTYFNDTWGWGGSAWVNLAPTNPPPARALAAMAYCSNWNSILLFGGFGPNGNLNDTWVLDPLALVWTRATPATVPPAMSGAALAFDVWRGVAVLVGRNAASTEQEVWEFDRTNWTRRNTAGPLPRGGDAIVYDHLRRRTVLFAGGWSGIGVQADTWEWDGAAWKERIPLVVPGGREWHALAWDTARNRVVLFGGSSGNLGLGNRNDTWQYAYGCDVVGPGHPGGGLPITCTSQPRIGSSFCVQFPAAIGVGAALIGLHTPILPPLPFPPPVFCDTAFFYTLGDIVLSTSGNPATLCIPIPADPTLTWSPFTLQGVAVDPASCVRATDGLLVVLQP
ncbi:MAG: kelch repeat-containing protein [Planctomycetota bacterium]